MRLAILDPKVRHNIALFIHLIKRNAEREEKLQSKFRAYINRDTGDLRFAQLEKTPLSQKDWKEVLIQLRPAAGDDCSFEVYSVGDEGTFACDDLAERAFWLFTKTLNILNQAAFDPTVEGKQAESILRNVAHLEMDITASEEKPESLIHTAWFHVGRLEAEHLLGSKPVGTFLFRKDEYAQDLENALNQAHNYPINCITLTYNDRGGKVSEKTLVFHDGSWLIYQNDPNLTGRCFASIEELLLALGVHLERPLLTGE